MKATVATIAAFSTSFASTFGSSIAVGAQNAITTGFGIALSRGTLIVSLYLVGCAVGPFFYAPIGEIFGRKYALGVGVTLMSAFTAGSAAAPTWNCLLAFRFLAGLGASAPMIVSAGILADIFKDLVIRGYIVTCLMAVTTLGSLVSSIISLQIMSRWPSSWSLCFWTHTAISGLSWLIVLIMPETKIASNTPSGAHYGCLAPELLQRLLLPTRMALLEPIVLATCLFLSLQYSIFYLFFQLIPPLFEKAGYVSEQNSGVLFIPFAIGTIIASLVYILLDPVLGMAVTKRASSHTYPESRRLFPAYVGGFLVVLALFLIGYCVGRRVHFGYALFLEGVFGCGFLLIFIGLTNYIVDAYQGLASSALTSSFFLRNIMGGALPFVAEPMRLNLGDRWSFYLLGFLSLPLACVVCGFQFYGPYLRRQSPLCQGLMERGRERPG